MKKRQTTTRICLFLLVLELLLAFFLLFGASLGLIQPNFGVERIFLAIILIFFICFSLFVSFIEAESHNKIVGALEERLTDSFKYIGKINLLMEEFNSIFVPKRNFPDTKAELKRAIKDYTERILAISRQSWAAIRVIDSQGLNTAAEYWTRDSDFKGNFNNKDIVAGRCDCQVISTSTVGLHLKAYCLLPKTIKEKEKLSFVLAMVGQLEMIMAVISQAGNRAHLKKTKQEAR